MGEEDIDMMTRHLKAVLARERREATAYALLTVLCTPAFVAIASLVLLSMVLHAIYQSDYRIDNASAIYAGMTIFLASAVGMMATGASGSASRLDIDRTWLAGAAIFLILLAVTYLTPLSEKSPAVFGIVYSVLAFLVLGLAGRAYMNHPSESPQGETPTFRAFVLAVAGFIVSAYAELLSASWLWFPPKPHDIRIAARVLCRLATEGKCPLHECVVDDRIVRLLICLKLLRRIDNELHLTPKGMDFVRVARSTGPSLREPVSGMK